MGPGQYFMEVLTFRQALKTSTVMSTENPNTLKPGKIEKGM